MDKKISELERVIYSVEDFFDCTNLFETDDHKKLMLLTKSGNSEKDTSRSM